MFYEDMTELQRAEEAVFVSKLMQAGWEAATVSGILHGGVSIHPEGNAFFEHEYVNLTLEYYAEESAVILAIEEKDSDRFIRLKFTYRSNFTKLIDWVTNNQFKLSFASLIKDIYWDCAQLFLVDEQDQLHLIKKPEDS